jgi:diadenosine tetraphosphate (Ap4A) HIT family hydrolase
MSSPFLAIDSSEWVASNELAFAIRDRYPVTDGHTLVVPKGLPLGLPLGFNFLNF